MGDSLPPGTRIRIACREQPQYARGAIVTFLWGATPVTHRVVGSGRQRRTREYLLTRGDRSALCDPPVAVTHVLGVVTECLQHGQWLPPGQGPAQTWQRAFGRAFGEVTLEIHPTLARWVAAAASRVYNLFHHPVA